MLWKCIDKKMKEVKRKSLPTQKKKEDIVEEWIKKNPTFLEEDLVIIAQQHTFPSKETADLIGIDENGNLVIIEIKRGRSGKHVDIQSLKYASYVSGWKYDFIEKVAKDFYRRNPDIIDGEFDSLTNLFENKFGGEISIETLNKNQRIIVVGEHIDERVGSVLVWLYKQQGNIKAVEFEPYEIDGNTYLYSRVVIPSEPYKKYTELTKPKSKDQPWSDDGKKWHREEKMSKETSKLFDEVDNLLLELFDDITTANWNQEFYISYKISGVNWFRVNTHKKQLNLDIHFRQNDFTEDQIEKRLPLSKEEIKVNNEKKRAKVRLKVPIGFNVKQREFIEFLKDCHDSFKKLYE